MKQLSLSHFTDEKIEHPGGKGAFQKPSGNSRQSQDSIPNLDSQSNSIFFSYDVLTYVGIRVLTQELSLHFGSLAPLFHPGSGEMSTE